MIALDNLFYILDLRMVAPSKKIELIVYSEWSLHDEGIVEERISYILDHYFRIDESRFLCCFEIKFMQFDLRSDFGYEIVNEVSECCFWGCSCQKGADLLVDDLHYKNIINHIQP